MFVAEVVKSASNYLIAAYTRALCLQLHITPSFPKSPLSLICSLRRVL